MFADLAIVGVCAKPDVRLHPHNLKVVQIGPICCQFISPVEKMKPEAGSGPSAQSRFHFSASDVVELVSGTTAIRFRVEGSVCGIHIVTEQRQSRRTCFSIARILFESEDVG